MVNIGYLLTCILLNYKCILLIIQLLDRLVNYKSERIWSVNDCIMSKEVENQVLHQIGKHVKKYREKRNLSQKKLAEMVLVSSSCITRLEREESMVSVFTLMSIAEALQVSISALVAENSDFHDIEFSILVNKISRCSQEQRTALIHAFENIVDTILLDV